MPQGPCRFGPMRSCIQPTTLRSMTMEISTVTIRKAKQKTALMQDQPPGVAAEHRQVFCGEVAQAHEVTSGASVASARTDRPVRLDGRPGRDGAAARGVQRQPDHPVGHRGDRQRQVDRPGRAGDAHGSPSRTPASAAVAADSRATAACRVAASAVVALLQPALVQQQPVAGEHRLALARAGQRPAGLQRRGAAGAVPGAEPASARRVRPAHPAGRACTSSASASMCSTRASGSAWRRVIWSGLIAASNGRARPSQLRKVPDFSATAATGSTTSARSVTSLGRCSRLTRKPTASRASSARAGSGRSASSTPADHQRAELAGRRGLEDLAGVPARPAGQFGDAPDRGDLLAGPRVGDRAAAGQQPGKRARLDRAPLARPARDPDQRGAGGGGGRDGGGQRAGHGRQPLADEDHRALGAQRLGRPLAVASRPVPPASASSHSVSVPGAAGSSVPPAFVQAAGGVGCDGEKVRWPCLRCGLAQPQEDAGRLLLRLEARPAARPGPSPARRR